MSVAGMYYIKLILLLVNMYGAVFKQEIEIRFVNVIAITIIALSL